MVTPMPYALLFGIHVTNRHFPRRVLSDICEPKRGWSSVLYDYWPHGRNTFSFRPFCISSSPLPSACLKALWQDLTFHDQHIIVTNFPSRCDVNWLVATSSTHEAACISLVGWQQSYTYSTCWLALARRCTLLCTLQRLDDANIHIRYGKLITCGIAYLANTLYVGIKRLMHCHHQSTASYDSLVSLGIQAYSSTAASDFLTNSRCASKTL
jgi:hypothetical protein